MAITTLDDLIAACTGAQSSNPTVPQYLPLFKTQGFTTVAGNLVSGWLMTGTPTGATAGPGAWATATQTTTGGLAFSAPAGSHTLYLGRISAALGSLGSLMLYDRLGHMSGLDGTSVGSQSVSSSALPSSGSRCNSNGVGVDWFVECYTTLGVSARTLTVTYTDDTPTGSLTTTVQIPASFRQGGLLQIPPGAGKRAIKSIESVQLSASTGTAGNFGITAARRIPGGHIPGAHAGGGSDRGPLDLNLVAVHSDTCFWPVVVANTTTLNPFYIDLTLIEG